MKKQIQSNQKFQRFKVKFNNLNLYLKFSIIFLGILIIGFLPIEIKNKSFLFSGLFVDRNAGIDGLKQHLVFMNDFISYIKSGIFNQQLSFYRFDLGLGSDLINHYSYYSLFDPILIIAYIIPIKYIEISYYLLIIIRLYLVGIIAILLGKKMGFKKDTTLLAVGLFYIFNVAVLFSALRHPMFINGPLYMALIFYGMEKIKHKESPVVLIISVFLALISQFYIFIYISFGFGLFCLIDLIKNFNKNKLKEFIKLNLYYLLGVMLAGFLLTSQLLATFAGARVGSKGFSLYNFIDYAVLIFSNILPLAGDHYTAGIGNFIVFIVCLHIVINEKRKTSYITYFIVLFIFSFFSSFSYLINLGSYVVNRWLFLLVLPSMLILGNYLENREYINDNSISRTSKFFIIILIVGGYFITGFLVLVVFKNIIGYIINSLLLFVIIYLIKKTIKSNINLKVFKNIFQSANLYKYVIYNSLIVLLIVSGIYLFILTPNNSLKTYYGSSDLFSNILEDDPFYRVEEYSYVAGVNDYSNDGIYYGYSSTSSYNTMTNGNVIKFLSDYNVVNSNNSVGYNGLNMRSRLLAINHVKYVFIRDSDKVLPPYGFSLYEQVKVPKYDEDLKIYNQGGNILKDDHGNVVYENLNIYINNNYLNFGVIFDSYLSSDDVSNLNEIEKEMLLTKTIIIERNLEKIDKYNLEGEVKKFKVNDFKLHNIIHLDNKLIVSENGYLTFQIPKVNNSEVFIEIEKIINSNYKETFTTTYETYKSFEVVRNYGYTSNMYIENKKHLVNLGYYEFEEDLEIKIGFSKGEYEIEGIGYYIVEANSLDLEIDKLNENSLTEIVFTNSGFTGKINTSKKGFMLLSIPYSKGFTVYVDGTKTEVFRANSGYMAVFVEEDSKLLEVKYITPGFEVGLYISAFSLIVFIFIIRSSILYKNKLSYQTNKNEEENEQNNEIYK